MIYIILCLYILKASHAFNPMIRVTVIGQKYPISKQTIFRFDIIQGRW